MKIKLKVAVILLFALMMSFSGCDFFGGDDGGSSGGGGSDPVYYAIGDTGPSGVGIVFYITDGGLHGLEAAPDDQDGGSRAAWSTITNALANGSTALPSGIGNGLANSNAIIAQNSNAASAAKLCRTYRASQEGDWFLPSKDELNELYTQRAVVGGFASDHYWSSSEIFADIVWFQGFDNGTQNSTFKNDTARVRPVRAF